MSRACRDCPHSQLNTLRDSETGEKILIFTCPKIVEDGDGVLVVESHTVHKCAFMD